VDRVFDALIAAAAADIARHRLAYLIVRRFRIIEQQRSRLHDLADLAKAALRDIELAPSLLNRVITRRMKTLDRRNLPIDHVGNRRNAGAYRLLVDDNGAGAAKRLAAAVFRTRQSGFIPEKPEKWEIGIAIPILLLAVNLQGNHDRSSLFVSC
jgi:hypothetical protein